MPRPRVASAMAVAVAMLCCAPAVAAQSIRPDEISPEYLEALALYQKSDLAAAMESLSRLPDRRIASLATRLARRRSLTDAQWRLDLKSAILLHTEKWFIREQAGPVLLGDVHLSSARALAGTLLRMAQSGQLGAGAPDRLFVRDWYLLVAAYCHGRAEVGWSRAYLTELRTLLPVDARVLLVSGADHEMLSELTAGYVSFFDADGTLTGESAVDPVKERTLAERFLTGAVKAAPDLVEARLRLGRVLYRRGDLDGAAAQLTAARSLATHEAVKYLVAVFMGMVETARGELARASVLFGEALRIRPKAQAASLGLSEVAHLSGRAADAAGVIGDLLAHPGTDDPWWLYITGSWWHFEAQLVVIRAVVQS